MFGWFKKKQGPRAPEPRLGEDLAMRINDAVRANRLTPDIHNLERRRAQLLFIHCELQKRHTRHGLVEEYTVPLYKVFTQESFTHMKYSEETDEIFSVAVRTKYHTIPHLPILGELCAILPHRLLELDKYKLNGVLFTRERVKITIPHRRKDLIAFPLFQESTAWMYVGRPEYWNKQLDGGYTSSAVRAFGKNRDPSYTHFTRMEVNESLNSS